MAGQMLPVIDKAGRVNFAFIKCYFGLFSWLELFEHFIDVV